MQQGLAQIARLKELIRGAALPIVLQPVVDLANAAVVAYQAVLLEGEAERPGRLQAVADYAGMQHELETAIAAQALRRFVATGATGRLHLAFGVQGLLRLAAAGGGNLLHAALEAGIGPARLVLALEAGNGAAVEAGALADAVAGLRQLGLSLVLKNFGSGAGDLQYWAALQPDAVYCAPWLGREIHSDARRVEILSALCKLALRLGTRPGANGIGSAEDLMVLRDLGCAFAAGAVFGQAGSDSVITSVPEVLRERLRSSKIAILPGTPERGDSCERVERLLVAAPTVQRGTQGEALMQIFLSQPDLHAVAVVDEGMHPVGLVNRRAFVDRYAQPYHRELYGRRSCCLFMNGEPLVVEKGCSIDSLISVLTGDDQRYLHDGFVITEAGRYIGLATGESLVRAVTERRIEAARHANPLTALPGNIPITEHIRRLLQGGVRFAACYFDLNNFKPYNDLYGYWRGDEMIKLLARTLAGHCDLRQDFLGHVGGDDFVVLYQSEDWLQRCDRAREAFNAAARELFDAEALAAGGIRGEDRQGYPSFFPLTTVAAGVVEVRPGQFHDPAAVASAAATAKKQAKAGDGICVLDAAMADAFVSRHPAGQGALPN